MRAHGIETTKALASGGSPVPRPVSGQIHTNAETPYILLLAIWSTNSLTDYFAAAGTVQLSVSETGKPHTHKEYTKVRNEVYKQTRLIEKRTAWSC